MSQGKNLLASELARAWFAASEMADEITALKAHIAELEKKLKEAKSADG